jgi:hypothetical protein
VAADFLKDVDEGDTVMEQMIEQLNRVKPMQAESSLNKQVSGNFSWGAIDYIGFEAVSLTNFSGCTI